MGFRVEGLGLRVQSSELRVTSLGCRVVFGFGFMKFHVLHGFRENLMEEGVLVKTVLHYPNALVKDSRNAHIRQTLISLASS